MRHINKFAYIVVSVIVAGGARGMAAVGGVEKQERQVVVGMDGGELVLRPRAEGAVEVLFLPAGGKEAMGFVFAGEGGKVPFEVGETAGEVNVSTKRMRVILEKGTGALQFEDAGGKVFLREEVNGREVKPVEVGGEKRFSVQQGFALGKGEHLFGLGQFQDGIWDWRGLPVELRQLNTQIALPMVVSSGGYGVLWNNASRTDFNLPGEEVGLSGAAAEAQGGATATEQLRGGRKGREVSERRGTFVAGAAGTYAFCTRDGDRRDEIAIVVDGKEIAGVKNMWTPRAVVGTVRLEAGQKVAVVVRGGGKDVKLFARPLAEDMTFHSDVGSAEDYVVFCGPTVDRVIAGYREVTGAAPMWPEWAYGFWQCRERYSSEQQILEAAAEFRKRKIPVDLLVQDWQYWGKHGWGAYAWDAAHYPTPGKMIEGLHGMNVKFMISVWCNPQGATGEELRAKKLLAGQWIDVFNREGRAVRWKHIEEAFFSKGADGWWGDATEPGDPGTDLLGKRVAMGPGDEYTSAYPLFASESLWDGQRGADAGKRVCILTRSAFPGMQRFGAAAWSGDINGNWETFRRQIPAGLNFSVAGIPYWTTDCGGFFHPGDQYTSAEYNELLTRWFEWSTFCPILRIHGYQTATEMWKWLPGTQKHLLAYDEFRYRMLPYVYSEAWRVTHEGWTMMRPLGMDFGGDAEAWGIGDEYMFGSAFLVSPVTEAGAVSREVYLPAHAGGWVDFWTGEKRAGGERVRVEAPVGRIPLEVPAGTILPLGPVVQYAGEKGADPVEVRVYAGADGAFDLYEDAGDGYGYARGERAVIPMRWDEKERVLTIGKCEGDFAGRVKKRTFRVVVVGEGRGVGFGEGNGVEVRYEGKEVRVVAGG